MSKRGFTLIELLVGVLIGVFLTTAAVGFVRHETRLMGLTQDRLALVQSSRAALDLLSSDLRQAGLGLVRDPAGNFPGFMTGPFTVNGIQFNTGNDISLSKGAPSPGTYTLTTMDLGIRVALGQQATIVGFTGIGSSVGTVQICNSPGLYFRDGELVLLQDEFFSSAQSVRFANEIPATGDCPCANPFVSDPCKAYSWQLPDSGKSGEFWQSFGGAGNINYRGGQTFGAFSTIVYFVSQAASGDRGELRRVDFDSQGASCLARDGSCGAEVAGNVEAMFYKIWAFTPATATWMEVNPGDPIDSNDRVRVDMELVVRSRVQKENVQPVIQAQLAPAPVDIPGAGDPDKIERQVFRTSVDIRNSGRASAVGGI